MNGVLVVLHLVHRGCGGTVVGPDPECDRCGKLFSADEFAREIDVHEEEQIPMLPPKPRDKETWH